jgi:rubrerythrin
MSMSIDALVTALGEEALAHHERYTELANRAEEMGQPQTAKLLRAIVAAETARVGLYRKALTSPGHQTETYDYYICPKCGVAVTEAAPEKCPLCDTPGSQFERIS